MRVQQRFESENVVLVAIDLLREGIVFARVDFNLGLQIRQPLLLPLPALECRDSVTPNRSARLP